MPRDITCVSSSLEIKTGRIQRYECKGRENILNAADPILSKHELVEDDQSGLTLKVSPENLRFWSGI